MAGVRDIDMEGRDTFSNFKVSSVGQSQLTDLKI